MHIDKEKLKKVGNIVFYILGGIAIVLVIIFTIQYVVPMEASKSSRAEYLDDLSYYTGENSSDVSVEEGLNPDDFSASQVGNAEIKTGQISVTVDDLDTAKNEFESIRNKYDGIITYSYENGEGIDRYVYETIKVKSEDFEKVFEEISKINGEVEYSSTDTTDVTEEYVDLQSRLTNLKAVEAQLLEIMESAETVEDTLAVYTELSNTRLEIEVLEGQIRYLDNQTNYSYITVTFSLSSVGAEISEEEWKPYGVLKDAFSSFVSVLQGTVNVLIWALVFSPIVIAVIIIYKIITRRSRKSEK